MTSTSQMRKPFFKPWWCGCATTSRIDSRTSGCFWPLSDYRFFLHRWGSRQGGIEITPASLPESKAVMNLLCPLFIKILFFAVNKPREQIHNAFFPTLIWIFMQDLCCFVCKCQEVVKLCLQKFPQPVMSHIQFMLIKQDKGNKQMLFAKGLENQMQY